MTHKEGEERRGDNREGKVSRFCGSSATWAPERSLEGHRVPLAIPLLVACVAFSRLGLLMLRFLGPVASESHGSLMEMQNIILGSTPTQSEVAFLQDSQVIFMQYSWRHTTVEHCCSNF